MEIRVRPRKVEDSRGVRRVARKAWRSAYAGIAPAGFVRDILRVAYARHRLATGLREVRRDAFVAERSGRIVGYADVIEGAVGHVELARIYVLPDEQRRGVGRALLAAAVAAARRRGAARLEVAVDARNRPALRWYAARGFRRCGTADFVLGRWQRPQVVLELVVGEERIVGEV